MSKSLPPRPTHCTRRRMKPYIDSCECEWCVAVNQQFEDSLRISDRLGPQDTEFQLGAPKSAHEMTNDELGEADTNDSEEGIDVEGLYPQVSKEEIGGTREGD